jgi:MFS transporter, OFA family, oxalate/formate antiporter
LTLVIDNILNGLARPFFGWVSDLIGREIIMGVVFTIGAFAYWGLGALGHTPYAFIVLAGLVFFTWGEIFSLFPAIATDTYGGTYATTNAGLLYTAKGAAVWVVPLTSIIKNHAGSWYWVFVFAAAMNLTVAALALFALKPMRRRIAIVHDPETSRSTVAHPRAAHREDENLAMTWGREKSDQPSKVGL